jgi:nucleotide-binding universal stress UspA family protein
VESGEPAERILEAARDEDADALALTTHARGNVASLLMGSVAHEVVRRAGRPVFLVRPGVTPPRQAVRRILVPLAVPAPIPSLVEAVARETDAEVRLIHVIPFPRIADPVMGFNPAVFAPLQLPEAPWLDNSAAELVRKEIRTSTRVIAGVPDEAILREGREENADLIVLQPRRRGGLSRLISGSVTEAILRQADRAVLVCRKSDEPA